MNGPRRPVFAKARPPNRGAGLTSYHVHGERVPQYRSTGDWLWETLHNYPTTVSAQDRSFISTIFA